MIRALLIDDEPPATELLATLLREFIPDVEVAGEAHSVSEGIRLVDELKPDLVFLDVQMPMGGGFALLRSFEDLPFEVIFTTAYDQYAIKAIQFSALDYILKPITLDRLQEAISRFRRKKEKEAQREDAVYFLPGNLVQLQQQATKIVVPIPRGMKIVTIGDITHLRAAGTYAEMVLADGKEVVLSKGLKYFEQLLEPFDMVRVHDSFMVNLHHVDRYLRGRGGEVHLKDGTVIEVSRGRKDQFLKALKNQKK